MAEKLSLIASLTPRRAAPESIPSVFRIRPQVVDTSILLPDVAWASGTRSQTMFLSAVSLGIMRPFAAHHVWAEVPRTIADRARAMAFDPRLAEAIWWEEYLPLIRFMDVGGLPDPRVGILDPDPTDAPTIALAGLLGQVVVAAADADIRDLGVAARASGHLPRRPVLASGQPGRPGQGRARRLLRIFPGGGGRQRRSGVSES
jgi:hypothetical protein